MLKKKKTRIIALITAMVMLAICTFVVINSFLKSHKSLSDVDDYMSISQCHSDLNNIYDELWLIGNIYLKNTDSKGKYICSDNLKKSIIQGLTEKGLMTSDGKPKIKDDSQFEYYVAYGDSIITNTNKSLKELTSEEGYYLLYDKGGYRSVPLFMNGYISHNEIHETNYGMTYYQSTTADIALFDYDISNLRYYLDERGTKIYYKTDGSTPLPEYDRENVYNDYNYDNYGRYIYEYEIEDGDPISETTDIYSERAYTEFNDGDTLVYDGYQGQWVKVNNEKFVNYSGNDSGIIIAIAPNSHIINSYKGAMEIHESAERDFLMSVIYMLPLLLAVLILTIYILIADGWNIEENKFTLKTFDKVWSEIPIILFVFLLLCGGMTLSPGIIHDINSVIRTDYIVPILYTTVVPLLYAMIMVTICLIARKVKCGSFIKDFVIFKILKKVFNKLKKLFIKVLKKVKKEWKQRISVSEMFKHDAFTRKFLIRLGICSFAEAFLVLFCISIYSWGMMLLCSLFLLGMFIFLNFNDLMEIKKLSQHIENMKNGDYSPVTVQENNVTYYMTDMLNNISDGIQNAVEQQLKSERMKIDLVTNVSHDLKTPLTSIISYIDLLSMEELSPEASDYVKILSQKSERLKTIVSDVFDLAKATSNTDINFENIDAVILMGQVKADMADKIEKYGKEIRTDIKLEAAPIYADGKKLYRVFQNLIDNALKYSMDGTRIYLKLYGEENNIVIELKNISAYEMTFSPDEITERFTRGDESRTSEGNGLGLSIAKSFTEACGGTFKIKIDDDVFIAEVKFPVTGWK